MFDDDDVILPLLASAFRKLGRHNDMIGESAAPDDGRSIPHPAMGVGMRR
jgi:hypothetical protein